MKHLKAQNGKELFPSVQHDHDACMQKQLQEAEQICRRREVRLTPLRRRVLEIISEHHEPIGAYAILARLAEEGKGGPPTVYRALDFLMAQGLIHRVASMNAYVVCARPGVPHAAQFLICRSCRVLAELDDASIETAIRNCAARAGFTVQEQTVENFGLCPNCRNVDLGGTEN